MNAVSGRSPKKDARSCRLGATAFQLQCSGLAITSYDISPDGEGLVFAATEADGISHIWMARLDRRSSPTRLSAVEGLGPVFGSDDEVYYRGSEGGRWYIFALTLSSGQIRKFTPEEAVNSPIISPDRQWILSWVPVAGKKVNSPIFDLRCVRLFAAVCRSLLHQKGKKRATSDHDF
jgi:hypothetical protein